MNGTEFSLVPYGLVPYGSSLVPYDLNPILPFSVVLYISALVISLIGINYVRINENAGWSNPLIYINLTHPESLPQPIRNVVYDTNATCAILLQKMHKSGKVEYRFKINGIYYYPDKNLVTERAHLLF